MTGAFRRGAFHLVPCGGMAGGTLLTAGGGAAIGDGRDTGLHRPGNRLKIRLAFDPAIKKEVIELAFPGVILEKAESGKSAG